MYMNEEKLPFKDLPREVQHDYLDLMFDGKLEYLNYYSKEFYLDQSKFIHYETIYRPALEKPSLDWSQIHEKWRYCARDEDGDVWLYEDKPEIHTNSFAGRLCCYTCITDLLKSYKPGTVDWKDSLIERP